jgi:transcriptional regulator
MFVRSCWRPHTPEEMYRLIEDHPWALLVNNGEDGPYATNLPLLLDRSKGERGVLVGHIARTNDHARVLRGATLPTLAVFEGPYSYVTPSWYPKRDMPSTYYYTAVHCYGRVHLQTDAALEQWLGTLTDRMETGIENRWRVGEIERSEITRRLPSIVGFELQIERIEGKFKLGQDEPKRDALAVAERLARSSDPAQRALGEMTRRYSAERPDSETP